MGQAITTFSYDFNKSYYENFLANRYGEMRNSGQFAEFYPRLWEAYDETKVIDGVTVNNGIDIKTFVQTVYNGTVTLCMLDALARAVSDVIGQIFGCSIGKAIFKVISFFTDLLGSFICTATIDTLGTECGTTFLKALKDYRDVEIMSNKEGIDMVRYYTVIGPRIVEAINNDLEKHTVYAYLWNNYIEPLGALVENNEQEKVIYIYFTMMDEMVKRYNLDVSPKFNTWVEESLITYKEVIDG